VLVWTWTGQTGEGVFGVSVVVKGWSPQEGRRRIAVVTRVDEVHVGITKKVREIAAGVVLDGEIQQRVAAIAAEKRRRLKEARRRGGDRISENVRSNPTRTPRARWMAQCLQTIYREMRHEENRKRRLEMERLGDEKAKEAVDNKNAVIKSPTEKPRRVADDRRRSKWEESVDSARQKTLAVVYSLVVLANMRELLKEKRMKNTSEVERSEAASRIQRYYRRWIRTCRVGSTLRVDCGGAAEVVGGNARKIKNARIVRSFLMKNLGRGGATHRRKYTGVIRLFLARVGLLQKRWRGVLARRRARVEVLRRRIERMAVVEEEKAQRGDRRRSEEGWPTVGQERVSSAFFESIIDLPLTRKGEEEWSVAHVMDSTPLAVTHSFLYDYVVAWEKMKGRQSLKKRREERWRNGHGSWMSSSDDGGVASPALCGFEGTSIGREGPLGRGEMVYDAASDVRGKAWAKLLQGDQDLTDTIFELLTAHEEEKLTFD
ncbi:hypothetical protein FOZ63_015312, partial [Perkinsus olseni]